MSVYTWSSKEPFIARSMLFTPEVPEYSLDGKLYAVLPDGEREFIGDIRTGRANPQTDFLPTGAETFSFRSVKASQFELVANVVGVGAITLGSQPMVAQFIEKQMGRMHPTPTPRWESYIFPDSIEPGWIYVQRRMGQR